MNIVFYLIAALTLAGGLAAMLLKNTVHCALALAVAFAGIGALYLNLGAQFLGLAQLLVYVGAVAVLIVFVILLTRGGDADAPRLSAASFAPWPLAGLAVAAAVFAVLGWAIFHSSAMLSPTAAAPQNNIRQLGVALMDAYVLPLEAIGLMLTAALIGAVVVAMKEKP